jgi:hypothetical protein
MVSVTENNSDEVYDYSADPLYVEAWPHLQVIAAAALKNIQDGCQHKWGKDFTPHHAIKMGEVFADRVSYGMEVFARIDGKLGDEHVTTQSRVCFDPDSADDLMLISNVTREVEEDSLGFAIHVSDSKLLRAYVEAVLLWTEEAAKSGELDAIRAEQNENVEGENDLA